MLIIQFFAHLGFVSCRFFQIAPFSDYCLILLLMYLILVLLNKESQKKDVNTISQNI